MNYIGLNICSDNEMKYYKKSFKSQIIEINYDDVVKIDSVIVDSSIIEMEYIDSISSVKVHVESLIKILFLGKDSNIISSIERSIPSIEYIYVDSYIDGNTVCSSFIKNKSKSTIYTDDIFCDILNKNTVVLTYYNIIDLKIIPSFYISYYIENGVSNNLFVSYSNGNNLTQKTFDNFFTYDNIVYSLQTSKLIFLGHNNNQSYIYYTDAKSKSPSKLNCISDLKSVESFCLYNKNKLLISLYNNPSFYTYDINKRETSKLNILSVSNNFSKVHYDNNSNKIYFIYDIDTMTLCTLDRNYNLEVIPSKNVLDYIVDSVTQKILIKSSIDESEILYIIYPGYSKSEQIHFDFEYDKIIKFDFLQEDDFEYIVVLYKDNDYNYLIKYNLTTFTYIYLCASYYINDFDIDYYTNKIFVCYKSDLLFKVVEVYKDMENSILQTTNDVKNIFLKK